MIFVFGSNERGLHGAGAAHEAHANFGAKWGQGVGMAGRSYAIPTKDDNLKTLPLEKIQVYVRDFLKYAKQYPDREFFVTAIGCGLAGYKPQQLAPMFKDAPLNCTLHRRFIETSVK